jgi:hypothetical protein
MATPSSNRRAASLRPIGANRYLTEDYTRAPDELKTLLGGEHTIGDSVMLQAKMQGLKPLKQNTKDRTESQSQIPREKEKEKPAEQKKLERGKNKVAVLSS